MSPTPLHSEEHPAGDSIAPQPSAVDFLDLARHLQPAERQRLHHIHQHLQRRIRPASIEPWNREEFPTELLTDLAELGLGETLLDGSSQLFQGLASAALARADVSLSALIGIHNELILGTIDALGSPQQKDLWLPKLRRLEALGAFSLTEPHHGSDIAGGLETSAELTESGWVIRGGKRWIGAGTIAAVAIVWARDASDGAVKGFLVPTDTPGYRATKIRNKTGLRIMQNADLEFDDVTVPESALLPGATSFSTANRLLMASRAWVGWQAVGAQQALFDLISSYSRQRTQFGVPIGSFQLIQSTLATVAGNLAASASMMADTADIQERGELTMMRASMVKATLTRIARESAALAREVLGGNGIVSDYEAAKIAGDIEAIYTYEGTHSINSLIVGRAITGVAAFV